MHLAGLNGNHHTEIWRQALVTLRGLFVPLASTRESGEGVVLEREAPDVEKVTALPRLNIGPTCTVGVKGKGPQFSEVLYRKIVP